MPARWVVDCCSGSPHLHVRVPAGELEAASPSALAFLCYVAASAICRTLAAEDPHCPFQVLVDPQPRYLDDEFIGGCVALVPWSGRGEAYLKKNPRCVDDYADMLKGFAGLFNTDSQYHELRDVVAPEPPSDDHDEPPTNAPGPHSVN